MSWNADDRIYGLPRRPRVADASASTIIWAIAGGLIAGPIGALLGGAAGNAVANQRQPLEMAIRDHVSKSGLNVVFFYPSPRSVKVTLRGPADAYWTVESIAPDHLNFGSQDDISDWLYGDLVTNQLPHFLPELRVAS